MYKVLLVDDEILVREAISAKIEWGHLGFELVGDCENGKAAIEFLKENPVDVVLTDICMPSGKNWTVRERRRSGSMRFKKHIGPIQRMRH